MISEKSKSFVHIPTPGDHYSSATGSAIMSIINELTKMHNRSGGVSQIIVSSGTRHDYAEGECTEVPARRLLKRSEKIRDIVAGFAGMNRKFETNLYRPAFDAIEPDFDGTIFLWNAPGGINALRHTHPKAQICLYAQNWLFKTYTRGELSTLVNNVDKIVCCSTYIAEETQQLLGNSSNKIIGIVNGVDTNKFKPGHNSEQSELKVLFVGRIQPFKGPHLLIKAAQKLKSANRKFKVRIVGSSGFAADSSLSEYEKSLRKLAAPVSDIVQFQPFVDRHSILQEYANASISCVPSIWNEPCSLTVPESIACGLPTIASTRGGIPEVGGEGVLYFDPKSVNQLAEKLEFLLENEGARKDWSLRARLRAEQISWDKQYEKLRNFLDS